MNPETPMPYRDYPPPTPALFGYDPVRDLPPDHLVRLVEQIVEAAVQPPPRLRGRGQPPFDPRLCLKVLVYGYATGIRSSRQLERLCRESLPYLFLTRGDTPSYRTLCLVRVERPDLLEEVFLSLFVAAQTLGMQRVGQIVVDSTKLRANASPEAVLTSEEYEPVRQELRRILEEAQRSDEREDAEGWPGETRLGKTVAPEQMRDIVRRVRKQLAAAKRPPDPPAAKGEGSDDPPAAAGCAVTPQMLRQLVRALSAIEAAQQEGRRHLCLTDPEARMMPEGRERKIRECYSLEVAVDKAARLLVAGAVTAESVDNCRLEPLVAAAKQHEPGGVRAVDADSGYYGGDPVARLLSLGIDACIPDPPTAADLHRGFPIGTTRARSRGAVEFTYQPEQDRYGCPEGNRLVRRHRRKEHGQWITLYRAEEVCTGCPQASRCLTHPRARNRTLAVSDHAEPLEAARQRFGEREHQERYRHRGEFVETVFGYWRATLGYGRWLLRGKEKVGREARLMLTAYQLKKVHRVWAAAP